MNTKIQDVITVFQSRYVDISGLPEDLVECWAEMAVGTYEREVDGLKYSSQSKTFSSTLPLGVIDTLAYIMKMFYLEREFNRINKKINIIGKDLSLNDTGTAKKMTLAELEYVKNQVHLLLDQSKTSAYGGA
jgi:hypothetical protein